MTIFLCGKEISKERYEQILKNAQEWKDNPDEQRKFKEALLKQDLQQEDNSVHASPLEIHEARNSVITL